MAFPSGRRRAAIWPSFIYPSRIILFMAKKRKHGKPTLLAIAIAIIFAFFVGAGIAAFYPSPEYQDFCSNERYPVLKQSDDCTFVERPMCGKGYADPIYTSEGCVESYVCETCNIDYGDARDKHNQTLFIVTVIAGLIAIIVGVALPVAPVAQGLMGGGMLIILYGLLRNWHNFGAVVRFIILGLVLAALIWLGYKKFKK